MKLNYYTYTVKFLASGTTCRICIKDIVDLYCSYEKKQSVLEKTNKINSKKLYFAKADQYLSVYYLMTPTELHNYRSLNRNSGSIKDLQTLIGSDSLEKVTYVHLDDKEPIIGIAASHGGASHDDVEFYLNRILNGLMPKMSYRIQLKPLNSGVSKSNVKNIKMLSEAKVILRNDSKQFNKLGAFITAASNTDNIEIEIRVKRTNKSRADIKSQIEPLLDIIKNDRNNSDFAEVYLRGKAYTEQETIKEILLDQTMIIFDIIYPNTGNTIEAQIQDKRYANSQVDKLAADEFNKYKTKLKITPPCQLWSKLTDKTSY